MRIECFGGPLDGHVLRRVRPRSEITFLHGDVPRGTTLDQLNLAAALSTSGDPASRRARLARTVRTCRAVVYRRTSKSAGARLIHRGPEGYHFVGWRPLQVQDGDAGSLLVAGSLRPIGRTGQ